MTTLTIRKGIIVVALFLVAFFTLGCSQENNVPDAGTVQRDTVTAPDSGARPTTTTPAEEVKGANTTQVCIKVKPLVEDLYDQTFQIPELKDDPYATEAYCRIVNGFPGRGLSGGQTQILLQIQREAKTSITGEGCIPVPSWEKVKEIRTKPPYNTPEVQGVQLSQITNYLYQEKTGISKLTFQTADLCVYVIELRTDPASSASSLDNLGQLAPAIVSTVIENANSR